MCKCSGKVQDFPSVLIFFSKQLNSLIASISCWCIFFFFICQMPRQTCIQVNDRIVGTFSAASCSLFLSLPEVLSNFFFKVRTSQPCENHAKTYIWVPKHEFKSLTLISYSVFLKYYSNTSLCFFWSESLKCTVISMHC